MTTPDMIDEYPIQPCSTLLRMVSVDIQATRDGFLAFVLLLCIVGVWL